mgnify:FL=1
MHKKQDCYISPAVIEKMLIITAYSYPIYPAASLLVITSRSNIIRKRSVRIPFVGNGAGQ